MRLRALDDMGIAPFLISSSGDPVLRPTLDASHLSALQRTGHLSEKMFHDLMIDPSVFRRRDVVSRSRLRSVQKLGYAGRLAVIKP